MLQRPLPYGQPHVLRGGFDLRKFSSDAALVVGAAVVANLFSFVFHFVLSRRLGPDSYGTLVTMMAFAGMLGVLGSSIGTVAMQEAAKLWTQHLEAQIPPFVRRTSRPVLGLAIVVSVGLVLVGLSLQSYLHIGQPLLWWLLALWVTIAIYLGFARGVAQGAHRFGIFAGSLISDGAGKVVFSLALVALGFGVAGALGGLAVSAVVALALVLGPIALGGDAHPWALGERLRLGGEALKVLAVASATSAQLYIDTLFAKHHFAGDVTGYFGAAGTIARTLPYGVSLFALIIMPKAAAARHASRDSLAHILALAAGIAAVIVVVGLSLLILFSHQIIALTYGPSYAPAAALLRMYAVDEALFALWVIAISYLVAVTRYEVFGFLLAAVVLEIISMAAFGSTPVRLLSIAIIVNAALLPVVWALALRTLRDAPQAGSPPSAENAL
ncbi:MAG TPA: hypothetical protein VGQ96_03860 [Candidatus Eremiobacteraceae bacterium]|nr:hypothetical protein [Candidatus Eremiobacteraceae bacterium]